MKKKKRMPEIETLPRRSKREELCLLMGKRFLLNPIMENLNLLFLISAGLSYSRAVV